MLSVGAKLSNYKWRSVWRKYTNYFFLGDILKLVMMSFVFGIFVCFRFVSFSLFVINLNGDIPVNKRIYFISLVTACKYSSLSFSIFNIFTCNSFSFNFMGD